MMGTRSGQFSHHLDIHLPHLPAQLEGLRIAHLTDLHISRHRTRFRRIAAEVRTLAADLFLLTGDYMDYPNDEDMALTVMCRIIEAIHCELGVFGVFGNHDTPELVGQFRGLPVRWLDNEGLMVGGLPLLLMGVHTDHYREPDALTLLAQLERQGIGPRPSVPEDFQPLGVPGAGASSPARLLLCHFPMLLPTAADLGVDLMFSGHTHGGQVRFPTRQAIYNSSDLPLHLTSGVLRHQDTLCVVSRGLGETFLQMRLFCPPHIPIYTLRRGPLPGSSCADIENVVPW